MSKNQKACLAIRYSSEYVAISYEQNIFVAFKLECNRLESCYESSDDDQHLCEVQPIERIGSEASYSYVFAPIF